MDNEITHIGSVEAEDVSDTVRAELAGILQKSQMPVVIRIGDRKCMVTLLPPEAQLQVENEHALTMKVRCRIICEEMGLKKFKTVSREMKYEIAQKLILENLCPYTNFRSGQPQYHLISSMLSKLKYSGKLDSAALPLR